MPLPFLPRIPGLKADFLKIAPGSTECQFFAMLSHPALPAKRRTSVVIFPGQAALGALLLGAHLKISPWCQLKLNHKGSAALLCPLLAAALLSACGRDARVAEVWGARK